jgi:hypothetical protein
VRRAHQQQQKDHQDPPEHVEADYRRNGCKQQRRGHGPCMLPQQAVKDVPAVELADWEQVQRGNEQANPAGLRHDAERVDCRAKNHDLPLTAGSQNPSGQPLK